MNTPSDEQLTVIFDGTSSFDSGVRRQLERTDRRDRIAWVPCQATATPETGERLCERVMVTITLEGDVDTGWRALARALTTLSGSPWPFRIATLPVICPLLTMLFALVARLLRRIPGVVPWCDQHPDTCTSGKAST